jgi:hypothetical protein
LEQTTAGASEQDQAFARGWLSEHARIARGHDIAAGAAHTRPTLPALGSRVRFPGPDIGDEDVSLRAGDVGEVTGYVPAYPDGNPLGGVVVGFGRGRTCVVRLHAPTVYELLPARSDWQAPPLRRAPKQPRPGAESAEDRAFLRGFVGTPRGEAHYRANLGRSQAETRARLADPEERAADARALRLFQWPFVKLSETRRLSPKTTGGTVTTWCGELMGEEVELRVSVRTIMDPSLSHFLCNSSARIRHAGIERAVASGFFLDVQVLNPRQPSDALMAELTRLVTLTDEEHRPCLVRRRGEPLRRWAPGGEPGTIKRRHDRSW